MKIDTIVFDLGKVLIEWAPENLYRKIFDEEDKMRYFLDSICTPDWNAEQDAGRTWADAVQLLLPKHPDYTEEIKAYWHRWPEMLNGPIQGTVDLLKRIDQQGKHRLLALTNWSEETWPFALERFDFLQIFEGILVSGIEGIKKPDPRIYQLLINRFGVVPERSLFIDDSLANIVAARKVGLHAIHFSSPQQLKKELRAADLIQ